VIAHIVLFEPKSTVSEGEREAFSAALKRAFSAIPGIERARVGRRISPDVEYALDLGHSTYKYAAVLEFADLGRLKSYLAHPAHQELGRLFWENCSSTVILDVEWVKSISDVQMDK
jgi:hypothetical protein